jgi:phosphopantothenoylcysteine decarboxylase/phosphopantothenate--cysteine ligase
MEEPEAIMEYLEQFEGAPSKKKLLNKRVLVTAGPTQEKIDPVRFIGNRSSGKMGYAIADAFARMGAHVTLVSGPVTITMKNPAVELVNVTSAQEMFNECEQRIGQMDMAVFNAAVADFTPLEPSSEKMKRGEQDWTIQLKPTRDIAAELGKNKRIDQLFVGFALETDEGLEQARAKLEKKNLDLIVLNSLQIEGAGFDTDTNRVTLIERSGKVEDFELKPKAQVAMDLVNHVIKMTQNA